VVGKSPGLDRKGHGLVKPEGPPSSSVPRQEKRWVPNLCPNRQGVLLLFEIGGKKEPEHEKKRKLTTGRDGMILYAEKLTGGGGDSVV